MLTLNKLIPGGRGLASILIRRAAQVQLEWLARQVHQFDAVDSQGRSLHALLDAGTTLRQGDVLVAEDGSLIVVQAAPQAVLVVRHCTEHGSPADLLRVAHQLGGQHVAMQAAADHLLVLPDAAIAQVLRQQHLIVSEALAPFEPEHGALMAASGGHDHHDHQDHAHPDHAHHDHGHRDGHDHGHDHGHAHPKEPAKSAHSHKDPD